MDLGFPPGRSVNSMIPKSEYLGAHMRLRYPGVDDLVQQIKSKGRGCALMKRDLSRAFRQFPIDPGDINLLSFSWRTLLFYNLAVVMVMSTSCYFCQMVTDALRFICQKSGFDMVNYLDDLAGGELWSLADGAFEEMGKFFRCDKPR